MRRWITSFRTLLATSVQIRLTCYFLVILLPLSGFSIYAISYSQKLLERQTLDQAYSALASTMDYIDATMQAAEELSTLIATDTSLNQILNGVGAEFTPGDILKLSKLVDQLSGINSVNYAVGEVSILHTPSSTLLSATYGARKLQHYDQEGWYQKTKSADGGIYFYVPAKTVVNRAGLPDTIFNTDFFDLMRMMDLNSFTPKINMLILTIPKEKMQNLVKKAVSSKRVNIYLESGDQHLIFGSPVIPSASWAGKERTITMKSPAGESTLLVKAQSALSKWSLIAEIPENEVFIGIQKLRYFSMGMIALSLLLAIWISWAVYLGIASPLKALSYGLKQLRLGQLHVRLPESRQDEFGYLTKTFNQMAEEHQVLIQDIYEKQLRLTKTELKFLQAQINPHFLYNTLDSIYWSAKTYDAQEVCDMVLNLSKFFRLSLSKGEDTFTIAETIEHLQYYLRIQQFRSLGRIQVTYHIAEDTKGLRVLKLILQPIVENACLHGLEKKVGKGNLTITTKIEEEMLCMIVADDGIGVAEERLAYINNALLDLNEQNAHTEVHDSKTREELFGLRNIKARLVLYYGPQAELYVGNKQGEGTEVSIRIPMSQMQNHEEIRYG